ncbi:MAG TPA: indole-3-glycerol phosphate synthase TrpC [Gemmatimonadales bacterium]|nr:indole-3-glycerol phosphate synthase TrpC [Gemmatimonadales bacterium]
MPTTLDQILASTSATLPALRERRQAIQAAAGKATSPRPFLPPGDRTHLALIAEVKRRSPSQGTISAALDPVAHAMRYAAAGASAISVLTDSPYFGGSLDDLRAVSSSVSVPCLRKDFILDELQILEARAAGASAVLLIVRALTPARLKALLAAARAAELEALVEVHDSGELDVALDTDARVIGVNSRNLDNFTIDITGAWALLGRIPHDRFAIAESGMASAADVRRAAEAGADGVLIGTALSSATDPSALARAVASIACVGR